VKRAVWVAAMVACAGRASAQDSSAYRELRVRVAAVDNVAAGAIAKDWNPRIGKQIEIATPLAVGEFAVAVGRIHYQPLTNRPPYAATLFTVSWVLPDVRVSRAAFTAGLRLSDYRMDFKDPTLVGGLTTEEEVMPGVVGRGRLVVGKRLSLLADASYCVLMLGHHTRMTLLSAGGQYALPTPDWLRDIMR
jgi:hypothetical protein